MYIDPKKYERYLRDECILLSEIDIYDIMTVQYRYARDVKVGYSLTSCASYEGYRLAINGTKGRFNTLIQLPMPTGVSRFHEITKMNLFGSVNTITVMPQTGGHGGSDSFLKGRLFHNTCAEDKCRQLVNSRDGAMSALTGKTARSSIESGWILKIDDLTELKSLVRILIFGGLLFGFSSIFLEQTPPILMVFSQAFLTAILPAVGIPVFVLLTSSGIVYRYHPSLRMNTGLIFVIIFSITITYFASLSFFKFFR